VECRECSSSIGASLRLPKWVDWLTVVIRT